VLLGHDISGLLHSVCCHNWTIVGFGVGDVDLALEENADGHLSDCMRLGRFILIDLVDSDVVFAISGCYELRHVVGGLWLEFLLDLL